jgi:hypothetical protein
MKLYIHIGLHKTASTSFQQFMADNSDLLANHRLFYPKFGDAFHHARLVKHALLDNWSVVEENIRAVHDDAVCRNMESVLVSAEGLESMLIEEERAVRIAEIAEKSGFSGVVWICVLREPWSYFNSLYAQLSGRKVCLNFEIAARQVLRFGHLSLGSTHARWHFVFDYDRFVTAFHRKVGGEMIVLDYNDFTAGDFIGSALLERMGIEGRLHETLSDRYAMRSYRSNQRTDPTNVELLYILNFLGLEQTPFSNRIYKMVFYPLIRLRKRTKQRAMAELKAAFERAFPADGIAALVRTSGTR